MKNLTNQVTAEKTFWSGSEPTSSSFQRKNADVSAKLMVLFLLLYCHQTNAQRATDSLLFHFQNPPQSARPRVWWHWMNGNIAKDGIRKDLLWMYRAGI